MREIGESGSRGGRLQHEGDRGVRKQRGQVVRVEVKNWSAIYIYIYVWYMGMYTSSARQAACIISI